MQTATNSGTDSLVKKMGVNSPTTENVQKKSSDIAKDFRAFIGDVESMIKSTANLSGEDLTKIKAKLEERISAARTSLENLSESVTERASKTATTANNYVHEQPWPVIGACAALGFLAGYLLTNRSSD